MKKYREFLFENDQPNLLINKADKLKSELRAVIISNVFTQRSISFSRDEINQLIKKRRDDRFKDNKEYLKDINMNIIKKLEKEDQAKKVSIIDLEYLLNEPDFQEYKDFIQQIIDRNNNVITTSSTTTTSPTT